MQFLLPTTVFAIVALVGVPALFALFIALWSIRNPVVHPEWLWFLGYGLPLMIGLVAVLNLPIRPLWLRIILALAYVPTMGSVLMIGLVIIACWDGNCGGLL